MDILHIVGRVMREGNGIYTSVPSLAKALNQLGDVRSSNGNAALHTEEGWITDLDSLAPDIVIIPRFLQGASAICYLNEAERNANRRTSKKSVTLVYLSRFDYYHKGLDVLLAVVQKLGEAFPKNRACAWRFMEVGMRRRSPG